MLNERVRDYEVSIWTLQDSFITVLKHSNLENKGQIQDGVMNIKNDNTLELTFSIPMYLYDGPTKKENPIWYNTRNGNIVVNMRKVKVIFNKKTELEEVFEFLITQVAERHEREELYCDVTCEGLAFHELGKIGYKIDLNQDDYIEEWRNWAEEDYENESEHNAREPHNNLEYWADKVLKGTKWSYEVSMDWAVYDGMSILRYISDNPPLIDYALIDISAIYSGIEDVKGELISYDSLTDEEKARINKMREEKGLRRNDKIYEDEYVSSWEEQDGALTPKEMVKMREKYRLLDKNESNVYNLTQDIAETFGVYCKYVYLYDNDYHIIGRKVVFYNNFIQEIDGELGITYPYEAKTIERTMDSTDIVTKMFVKNLTDSNMESGEASINQVEANRSKEDYLLNFDHFYSIGTISEEQYKEIEPYEAEMRRFNEEIEPLQSQLIEYTDKLTEADAAATIAKNAISLDTERISATDDLLNALTDGTGRISITAARPDICYIISNTAGSGYCINIRQEGIIGNTIHVYRSYDVSTMYLSDEITGYKKEVDEFGNLTGKLTNFVQPTGSSTVYVIYDYEPQLYYENIKKVWQLRKVKDEQEYKKQKYIVTQLDGEKDENNNRVTDGLIQVTERAIQKLLSDKQNKIYAFERMMGPALREGTWQPEDEYANYGDKYSENLSLTYNSIFNNNLVSIGWDSELFDDEQKSYYELGAALTKKYYPCIDLTNYLDRFTSAAINAKVGAEDLTIESLSFMFQDLEYESIEDPAYFRFFPVGSECQFAFLRQVDTTNSVIPVLMITGVETLQDSVDLTNSAAHARIGYLKTEVTEEGVFSEIKDIVSTAELQWIPQNILEKCETVYPRIRINSANVKNTEDELSILKNFSLLSNYEDYSVLTRSDSITGSYQSRYYITIKPEVIFKGGKLEDIYKCNFAISNTDLIMYLDAIQVLKENSIPKVSYTIEPSVFNIDFIKQIYKYLNRIVHINDADLKFENIKGYISELEINLDAPAEDQITITDYKTKFEDLFSSIVAQTEEMKKNSAVIGMTSSLFTTTGQLSSEAIQGAIYRADLSYAFNQGTLTIDEKNGIWGTSDSGVVAMRGGGIFTATEQDENGEWVWNTGILPSGINANLITSGQLDTNLIRIYAGDNLKFQLNGKGLFAYKSWLDDSPVSGSDADKERTREYLNYALQPAQYVVHDSEGLFLRAKKGARILNDERNDYLTVNEDIDRVSISWDGFTIRNWENEKVFYADGQGNLTLSGTIHAYSGDFKGDIKATSLTIINDSGEGTDINDYVGSRVNGSADTLRQEFKVADGELHSQITTEVTETIGENISNFTSNVLNPAINNLQHQVDGQIETYYYDGAPYDNAPPTNEWTTDIERERHIGDLYYDKQSGYAYRYFKDDEGTYAWQRIKDTDITNALETAVAAQDTADHKRRVFVSEPRTPYDEGDLWVQGEKGDILRCNTTRKTTGEYFKDDWILASKYTDDSALQTFINGTYKEVIDDMIARNDAKAETWYQVADPSTSWPKDELADHKGDIWYCNTTVATDEHYQRSYMWNGSAWEEMTAAPPKDLFDTFDGKAKVFVTTPTPPYDVGDLWVQGDNKESGDILRCAQARASGEYNAGDWIKASKYTDDSALQTFITGDFQTTIEDMKALNDDKAETWYQATDPSTTWKGTNESHTGDIWYCNTDDETNKHYQRSYMWNGTAWEEMKAKPPQDLFDIFDGKAQVFITTPTPPYDVGDLWFDSDTSEIMTCVTKKDSGAYDPNHWKKRNKYTDDTVANQALTQTSLNQTAIDQTNERIKLLATKEELDGTLGSIQVEYYLSNSATKLEGGSWSTIAPQWVNGKYMWQRTTTVKYDGTVSHSDATCIAGATGASGTSVYTHIRYSANANGSGFVENPSSTTKYIGIYTGTSKTAPTTNTSYVWSKYMGDNGTNGTNGKDGNGIRSITYYYKATANQTAPEASTITGTSIPTLSESNKYLWQKEVIDFTASDVADKTTVILLAVYGDKGKDGTSVTITSTSIKYTASASGTQTPTSGWSTSVPSVNNGQYLWTQTIVNYSDGTSTTAYSVAYKGTNGVSSYTHIKYSASSTGANFVDEPTSSTKYMGVYTGTSQSAPSTASSYHWSKYVGDNGTNGTNGKDGNGIRSITYYYKATSTQAAPDASTVTATSIPVMSESNKYLWQKEVIDFTDSSVADKTTVILLAVYGDKGKDGTNGTNGKDGTSVTITGTSIEYKADANGTTAPSSGWSKTIPSVANGQYLWTKTVVNYSDGKSTTAYAVAYKGTNGATGTGISKVTPQYYLSTSNTTQVGGSIETTPPKWQANHYLWIRSKIDYDNGTTNYSAWVLDNTYNDIAGRLSQAEATLVVQGGEIASRVTKDEFNVLGQRVSTAESSIKQNADSIKSKVSQTVFDELKGTVTTTQTLATQTANKFSWLVSSGTNEGNFTLTDRMATLITDSINFEAESFQVVVKNKVDESLNEMEIGGRNYLSNTGTMSKYVASRNVSVISDSSGAIADFEADPNKGYNSIEMREPILFSLVRGKQVTVSLEVRSDDAEAFNNDTSNHSVFVELYPLESTNYNRKQWKDFVITRKLSTEWQRIKETVILTDDFFVSVDSSGAKVTIDENTRLGMRVYNYSTYRVQVRRFKLELGNKATDWTPAPEDVDASIEDVQNATDENSSRLDEFEGNYVSKPDFQRLVRIELDGLHVGDNQTPNEAVLDSDGLGVRVDGTEYSRFAKTYARFGNYLLGLHPDEGGMVIRPA